MISLQELLGRKRRADALVEYRGMLYYRGAVPTKPGQAAIPARVLREEEARGFKASGIYRKRLRYFVDDIAVGSEGFVRKEIERLREQGRYLRRKNPISQLDGIHTSLQQFNPGGDFVDGDFVVPPVVLENPLIHRMRKERRCCR